MKRLTPCLLCLAALILFAVPAISAPAASAEGIVRQKAEGDIDAVWNRLLAALKAQKAPIFSTVDHKANAVAAAGLALPGARVATFGNPAVGTALMQVAPGAALDLPLRMLVLETSDGVVISWNDPAWIATRHGASPDLPVVVKMRGLLRKLADAAARPTR